MTSAVPGGDDNDRVVRPHVPDEIGAIVAKRQHERWLIDATPISAEGRGGRRFERRARDVHAVEGKHMEMK